MLTRGSAGVSEICVNCMVEREKSRLREGVYEGRTQKENFYFYWS
jgi:hypothetical protein